MPFSASFATGIRFLPTVLTLETRFAVSFDMSALPLAMPVRRFCHAAFMEEMEPEIVSDASFAVVPVIPILSWTTWIALTMSA